MFDGRVCHIMSPTLLCKESTTAIKGIAILLVIISHIGQFGYGIRMFVPLGGIGVAVFLILSGYGLMESFYRHGLKDFWGKRFLRVAIPYLIWIIVYSIFLYIWHLPFSIDEIRYWFVEYIIVWYFLFYIAISLTKSYKWLFLGVSAILLIWMMPCLQAQQSLSFPIGMFISCHKNNFKKEKQKMIWIAAILLIIGSMAFLVKQMIASGCYSIWDMNLGYLTVVKNVNDEDILRKLVQIFTKLPTALFIILIGDIIQSDKSKFLVFMGTLAYELYLVHMPLSHYIKCNFLNLVVFIILSLIFSKLLNWVSKTVIQEKVLFSIFGSNKKKNVK